METLAIREDRADRADAALSAPPHRAETMRDALMAYGCATAACLSILTLAFRLWQADLRVPFGLGGDAYAVQILVKTLVDEPGFFHNSRIGMPSGVDLQEFPFYDLLPVLLMKVLALVTGNYAVTVNLYYLLTYPLTTLSALFVLRRFSLSYAPALLAALLYTFLPYHIHRGMAHLFLASYFQVPLLVLVALWLFLGKPILWHLDAESQRPGFAWRGRYAASSLLLCASCSALGDSYYTYFAAYFVAVAALAVSLRQRNFRPLLSGGALVAVLVIGGAVSLFPTLANKWQQAPNPEPTVRNHAAAEIYAMKIAHLVLPIRGHRLSFLHDFMENYYRPEVPLNNENSCASLGLIGTLGFFLLLGRCLAPSRHPDRPDLMSGLSVLNLFGVLLGTIGGFGSIISLLGWSWVRSYNRVSIFLAFFALFAVALLLERLRQRRQADLLCGLLSALFLTVGLYDQLPHHYAPDFAGAARTWHAQESFVQRIEASVPAESMIFQLPYMSFPEHAPVNEVEDYDLAIGYLHSRSLRWSYGAMRGRESDLWQRQTAKRTPETMVPILTARGFRGILIDRFGYPETWPDWEARLSTLLKTEPLVSADRRYSFFKLADYTPPHAP